MHLIFYTNNNSWQLLKYLTDAIYLQIIHKTVVETVIDFRTYSFQYSSSVGLSPLCPTYELLLRRLVQPFLYAP